MFGPYGQNIHHPSYLTFESTLSLHEVEGLCREVLLVSSRDLTGERDLFLLSFFPGVSRSPGA